MAVPSARVLGVKQTPLMYTTWRQTAAMHPPTTTDCDSTFQAIQPINLFTFVGRIVTSNALGHWHQTSITLSRRQHLGPIFLARSSMTNAPQPRLAHAVFEARHGPISLCSEKARKTSPTQTIVDYIVVDRAKRVLQAQPHLGFKFRVQRAAS